MEGSTKNLRTHEAPSPAVTPPPNAAQHAEAAHWHHGIRMFLRDLDALEATGRIDPDARSVILWTLTRALPMVERAMEGMPAADTRDRA